MGKEKERTRRNVKTRMGAFIYTWLPKSRRREKKGVVYITASSSSSSSRYSYMLISAPSHYGTMLSPCFIVRFRSPFGTSLIFCVCLVSLWTLFLSLSLSFFSLFLSLLCSCSLFLSFFLFTASPLPFIFSTHTYIYYTSYHHLLYPASSFYIRL